MTHHTASGIAATLRAIADSLDAMAPATPRPTLPATLTTTQAAALCGLSSDGFSVAARVLAIEPAEVTGRARRWHVADVERVKHGRKGRGRPRKGI